MRYAVYGLRDGGKRWAFLAHSEGRHAQEAILTFRHATKMGGQMRAELCPPTTVEPIKAGEGVTTPINVPDGHTVGKWYSKGNRLVDTSPAPKTDDKTPSATHHIRWYRHTHRQNQAIAKLS